MKYLYLMIKFIAMWITIFILVWVMNWILDAPPERLLRASVAMSLLYTVVFSPFLPHIFNGTK
jgi:hypothetical protein